MLVLLEAQEGNWDEIDLMVRTFQAVNLAIRYSARAGDRVPRGPDVGRRLRDRAARRSGARRPKAISAWSRSEWA